MAWQGGGFKNSGIALEGTSEQGVSLNIDGDNQGQNLVDGTIGISIILQNKRQYEQVKIKFTPRRDFFLFSGPYSVPSECVWIRRCKWEESSHKYKQTTTALLHNTFTQVQYDFVSFEMKILLSVVRRSQFSWKYHGIDRQLGNTTLNKKQFTNRKWFTFSKFIFCLTFLDLFIF